MKRKFKLPFTRPKAARDQGPDWPVLVFSHRLSAFFFGVRLQLWRNMSNRVPHVSLWLAPQCPDFHVTPYGADPFGPSRFGVLGDRSVPSTFALRAFTWGLLFVW